MLVLTDAQVKVYERGVRGNNIGKSVSTLTILQAPAADLEISGVTTPADGVPGEERSVSWTVKNLGEIDATGSWTDRVYLSLDGTLNGAVEIGAFTHSGTLAVNTTYQATATVTLPKIADGNYRIVVRSDADNAVAEGGREANNVAASGATLAIAHPDLIVTAVDVPVNATSGDQITIEWSVMNSGTGDALGSWTDSVYLSADEVIDGNDIRIADVVRNGPIAVNGSYTGQTTYRPPVSLQGSYHILVAIDRTDTLKEAAGDDNNRGSAPIEVTLAPYADLSVGSVTAPELTIRDPARVTIGWTVTNIGTGAGITGDWTDKIILSTDNTIGNGDDIVIGEFSHSGALATGGNYSRSETIVLPAGFTGHYNLFVATDTGNAVFENGKKVNNTASTGHSVDIMPIPYADLTFTDVAAASEGASGQPLNVSWTIKNDGIGQTNLAQWSDVVYLTRNANGTDVVKSYTFDHIGNLGAGSSYQRSTDIIIPQGLSGNLYVFVSTGGPFEFTHGNNNTSAIKPVHITLSESLDLVVQDIQTYTTATEGDFIDIAWRVANTGNADGCRALDRQCGAEVGRSEQIGYRRWQFRFRTYADRGPELRSYRALQAPGQNRRRVSACHHDEFRQVAL